MIDVEIRFHPRKSNASKFDKSNFESIRPSLKLTFPGSTCLYLLAFLRFHFRTWVWHNLTIVFICSWCTYNFTTECKKCFANSIIRLLNYKRQLTFAYNNIRLRSFNYVISTNWKTVPCSFFQCFNFCLQKQSEVGVLFLLRHKHSAPRMKNKFKIFLRF